MEKLKVLSHASQIEAGEDGCRYADKHPSDGIVLTKAKLPNGRTTTLLKSLLSSYCEHNCYYCPFRSGRDFKRASFKPETFARLVINLTNAGLIRGVFLSSGVGGGGVRTQDRLIKTADIMRNKFHYQGYLHLKIMPGSEYDQIVASMRLADRVSINLEAPNAKRLPYLAPEKNFLEELMKPIAQINHIRENLPAYNVWKQRWPSSSTQFVVGGAGESDQELLETTEKLHRQHNILRAYFSAFHPHFDTPLERQEPVPLKRELRLYQADYLIRDYGFLPRELIFEQDGNLPLHTDPKLTWARSNLAGHPLEINHASREELLRIPGIGPKAVALILRLRRQQTVKEISSLERMGIHTKRAIDFILLNGKQPPRQLPLFDPQQSYSFVA